MKTRPSRGSDDEALARWEATLQAALMPVEPRAVFVVGLKQRLMEPDTEPAATPDNQHRVLWTAAGVLTSVLLVITGIKTITGLVTHLRHSVHKGGLTPAI